MRLTVTCLPVILGLTLAACGGLSQPVLPQPLVEERDTELALPTLSPAERPAGDPLQVVATTSIIGDVVANVGSDRIHLEVLIPSGQDPHSYEPSASDLALLREADVLYVNGLHFEEGLEPVLDMLGGSPAVVPVSAGVDIIFPVEDEDHQSEEGGDLDHTHEYGDPHTWQDPRNVMIWVANVAETLAALDPDGATSYRANAAAYRRELESLDAHIREQVARIPPEHRRLVTNHDALAYFARAYGFEVVDTIYIGAAEVAEPSAGQMAQLIDVLRAEGIRAIFVETTIDAELAGTIAAELGPDIRVLTLYTDSLGAPGSGAETYVDMMRANAAQLVIGLGE